MAASGLVIVFAFWWLYFDESVHRRLVDNRHAFVWGYGHYFVFAAAAAIGAGIAVIVDDTGSAAHVEPGGDRTGRTSLARALTPAPVPELARAGRRRTGPGAFFIGPALPVTAAILAAMIAVRVALQAR